MSRHASLRDDSGPASPASLASGHSELRLNCKSDKLERVENWRTAGETIYKYSVELLLQPNFTIFPFFKSRNAFDYLYLIFDAEPTCRIPSFLRSEAAELNQHFTAMIVYSRQEILCTTLAGLSKERSSYCSSHPSLPPPSSPLSSHHRR